MMLKYEIKVALLLTVFYALYRLFMSRDTLHTLKRGVLMLSAVLSAVLPFCVIKVRRVVAASAVGQLGTDVPEFYSTVEYGPPDMHATGIWSVAAVFAVGFAIVTVRNLASVWQICRILRRGRRITMADGTDVVVSPLASMPFSWMRWIVVPEGEAVPPEIICHEKAHVRLGHSCDLALMDLLTAFQWFNPVIWLMGRELRSLHEFEADRSVLDSGADMREYQMLILDRAKAGARLSAANGFSHSMVKDRIAMMAREHTPRRAMLKLLYMVPAIALSLVAFSRTVLAVEAPDDTIPFKQILGLFDNGHLFVKPSLTAIRIDDKAADAQAVRDMEASSYGQISMTTSDVRDENGNPILSSLEIRTRRHGDSFPRIVLDGKEIAFDAPESLKAAQVSDRIYVVMAHAAGELFQIFEIDEN